MQEEPDLLLHSQLVQRMANRQQLLVKDPDQGIGEGGGQSPRGAGLRSPGTGNRLETNTILDVVFSRNISGLYYDIRH